MELPIPEIPGMISGNIKTAIAIVKGVKEPYFSSLNGQEVLIAGKTSLTKRRVDSSGQFIKDNAGNIVKTQVPVPRDCVAIVSRENIKLRNRKEDGTIHDVSKGFKYVDFFQTKTAIRHYVYIVPKKYVFRVNACSLILTFNTHRVFYKGYRLALQNGNYAYLYVIPLKRRSEYASYRTLGIKVTPNFDREVNIIVGFWQQIGIIFNLMVTSLSEPVKGTTNLGYTELTGTLSIDEHITYTVSLLEENDNDLNKTILNMD
jgi:hypothetical protein